MASCSRWATRATCSRPAICTRCEQVPEIVEIGISALKIEGRYKDADYVALTTRAYRKAVDEAWAGGCRSASRRARLRLEQVYSRGLGPFFLTGTNHQAVVRGPRAAPSRRADGPRGAGDRRRRCDRARRGAPRSRRSSPATAWCSTPPTGAVPEEPEEGGRIFEMSSERGRTALRQRRDPYDAHPPRRSGLAHARSRSRQSGAACTRKRRRRSASRPCSVRVTAHEGEPLRTVWTVGAVTRDGAISDALLGAAQNRAIDEEYLREQLGRLGNTPYELADVELEIGGRAVRAELAAESAAPRGGGAAAGGARALRRGHDRVRAVRLSTAGGRSPAAPAGDGHAPTSASAGAHAGATRGGARHCGPPASRSTIWISTACALRRARARAGIAARVASPRVLKPGEERIVDFLLSWTARSWCARAACWKRCAIASTRD